MYRASIRQQILGLAPYTPGLSIDEIAQKYHLTQVRKMASNENPLGTPPLAQEAIRQHAASAFRYPRGGNPRLIAALAKLYQVPPQSIVIGNGSDEIIDLLLRITAEPGRDNIVCFDPCFNLYTIQATICGIEIRRAVLKNDFSFDFEALINLVDEHTRLIFLTTPDNPSGFCPPRADVLSFAKELSRYKNCLLLIDEAYMDFTEPEEEYSLLFTSPLPNNVGFLRTFSKSYGLAGLRLGYAILPYDLADAYWRIRLPFSVNILAEEAGLAALADDAFRAKTLQTVTEGRKYLSQGLTELGFTVFPSCANFLLFTHATHPQCATSCYQYLLEHGIIIRLLKSYGLAEYLRVSIGTQEENLLFLEQVRTFLTNTL